MKQWNRIELASQARLKAVEYLAPRFFTEVIGIAYEDCLVTDESDLSDFVRADHSMEAFLETFFTHYFVDPGEAGSTRIVDLLELLERHGVAS